MTDDSFRIAELLLSGYKCGHVMMKLALEAQGRDDPDLVRAMSGLSLGMGQGFNCGVLTAGCCVIGLCAGKADDEAPEDPRLAAAIDDFSGWFSTMTHRHGGIDCAHIMRFEHERLREVCPGLISESWTRLVEILDSHGIDIANPGTEAA
ncbi:DVU_1555 family C-GCAxxG-C-C protein [Oryzibacter oryziterrae]|uniref:DVU_1555 family C-GCAxxG-C-C protein n=1 Tax=Oryzibacter oryziterrae TaxID=2766474 RepID=UPI001F2F2685|nr:DV_1555 family C-GCAxxG-C-C protein [Oryzibacter oryziterrae]